MDNNYTIENTSLELIKFINSERLSKKINYKKLFRYYSKCLKKSIIEMFVRFSGIKNANQKIISGINMIFHIYYILIVYSNNVKLTIFLLERAILLYTEFILMSQDNKMVEEIYFIPNTNDAICFSFKKTIGPITINDLDNSNKYIYLKELCNSLKNIYKSFFKSSHETIELNEINRTDIDKNLNNIDLYFNKISLQCS